MKKKKLSLNTKKESEWGEGDEAEANNGDEEMELLEEEYKHLQHRVWLFYCLPHWLCTCVKT